MGSHAAADDSTPRSSTKTPEKKLRNVIELSPHPSPLPAGPAYVARATSAEWAEREGVRGHKMLEENSQI